MLTYWKYIGPEWGKGPTGCFGDPKKALRNTSRGKPAREGQKDAHSGRTGRLRSEQCC